MRRERSCLDPLILSTLLHLVACSLGVGYGLLVALSTTLSVLWHWQGEPPGLLARADYLVAGVWVGVDITLAVWTCPLPVVLEIILLTALVGLTNLLVDGLARHGWVPYETGHTAWHLLSAAKAALVATLLGRYS